MIVLDERTKVKQAIQRWVQIYGLDRTYGADKRGRRVGAELMALDQETATVAEVAEIIGNSFWVCERTYCDECGLKVLEVVEMGEPPDYESATARLCRDCLRAALRLLTEKNAYKNGIKNGMMAAAKIAENTGLDGSSVLWGREMIRKAIVDAAEKII